MGFRSGGAWRDERGAGPRAGPDYATKRSSTPTSFLSGRPAGCCTWIGTGSYPQTGGRLKVPTQARGRLAATTGPLYYSLAAMGDETRTLGLGMSASAGPASAELAAPACAGGAALFAVREDETGG